ncbi:MAG: hypothetical protein ACRYFZ_15665 [Janthinobacterium lividum]
MKLHLLATPLVATILLLSTLACSKKDEPAPTTPNPNTGSYKLDGQLVSCQAKAFEYPNRTGVYQDQLQIQLTIASASGTIDNLLLGFSKNVGSPLSAYYFDGILHMTANSNASLQTRSYLSNTNFTLSRTAGGGYSGTFSATSSGLGGVASSLVTEGVFTDVRP